MSEAKPSSTSESTYRFQASVKETPAAERAPSPARRNHDRLERVLAWTVRVVMYYGTSKPTNRAPASALLSVATIVQQGKTYVLYRRQMLELLRYPKPVFEQLAIELPCLMGFRAEEVGTWRAEYIDFQHGDTLVLDAKKKRLFTVPLNTLAARHAEEVLGPRSKGLVLRRRRHTSLDPEKPLSRVAVWLIWHKWTTRARLPNAAEISPLTGRRFFAAEWYYGQGLSLVSLKVILRHAYFETTARYVQSLVFHEDVKRDYDRFQLKLMEETALESSALQGGETRG